MSISEDDVLQYLSILIKKSVVKVGSPTSYREHKVKNVRLHSIKPMRNWNNEITGYDIEYSVEVYESIDDDFVPSKGKWVWDRTKIDFTNKDTIRDIKLNLLLKDPD